jgi:hypothetical protein
MGWWSTNKKGHSFSGSGEMVWGDGPADLMGDALEKIIEEFVSDWGRPPTIDELHAGLDFSARVALEDAQRAGRVV